MPANRRRNRRQNSSEASAGPFFFVHYSGHVADAKGFQRVVDKALIEAFGELGSAQFEFVVSSIESVDTSVRGILHVPHENQRRDIWAALTLLGNYGGDSVRFLVTATGDSIEEMKKTIEDED